MDYKQIQRQRNLASRYTQTVGQTPLMQIACPGYDTTLLLKMESFNPMGNMKFRMAISMVDAAEASGDLKPGGRIVESTSGNTGLGLATIAAERGYRFTAIVDHHAAQDKLRVMQALGAELIFVDDGETDDLSTAAREELAEKIAAADPEAFWTEQHNNPANSTGYVSLAYELMEVLGHDIDALVGAVGTGGSLCGTAKVLKGALPNLFVLGVEPVGSIAFGGPGGGYYQSGTGTPPGAEIGECVDFSLIDKGIKVSDEAAFSTCRFIAKRFGVLIGGSAGGALYGALQMIKERRVKGHVVMIVSDGGEKYLDTIFNDQWVSELDLIDDGILIELDDFFSVKGS